MERFGKGQENMNKKKKDVKGVTHVGYIRTSGSYECMTHVVVATQSDRESCVKRVIHVR